MKPGTKEHAKKVEKSEKPGCNVGNIAAHAGSLSYISIGGLHSKYFEILEKDR
jgi:hypothetical protein